MQHVQDTDLKLSVVLVNSSDLRVPVTGLASSAVTVQVSRAMGVWSVVTPSAWVEVGDGVYWVRIPSTQFSIADNYQVMVSAASTMSYYADVQVVADNISSIAATLADVVDVLALISADLDQASSKVDVLISRVPQEIPIQNGLVLSDIRAVLGTLISSTSQISGMTKAEFIDLMYNKIVTARHSNNKPKTYVAGTGNNQISVSTTLTSGGDTATESSL